MSIAKLNPLNYVTDWTPVPEPAVNASGWFLSESMTVTAIGGSEVSIGWFQAQGWTVTGSTLIRPAGSSVVERGGLWPRTTTSRWEADYRYSMKRRQLQSEVVLQDMINQFTKSYNEGRLLNDRRYDEILIVYNTMLGASQDELLDVDATAKPYEDLIDTMIAALPDDYTEYKDEVTGMLDDYGESMRAEINTRFNNEVAKAKQSLIARGMHNTMLMSSSTSGIEALRQKALLELDDRLVDKKLSQSDKLYQLRTDMRSRIEASAQRLSEMKRQRKVGAIEFRNAIITAMAHFMENRTDEYPGVAELAKLAAGLGYGEGSTVRA